MSWHWSDGEKRDKHYDLIYENKCETIFYLIIYIITLKSLRILATMMETTLKEAPITPVTGLCGMYIGGLLSSHLYSEMSCNKKRKKAPIKIPIY